MPKGQQVAIRRDAHNDVVTLYLTSSNQPSATIRVRRFKAAEAIERYESQGYVVRHPGFRLTKEVEAEKPKAETGSPEKVWPTLPVVRLTDGKIYASAKLAGDDIKASRQHIQATCSRKGACCKGHQFRYATPDEVEHGYKGELKPVNAKRSTKKTRIKL